MTKRKPFSRKQLLIIIKYPNKAQGKIHKYSYERIDFEL